TEKAKNTPSGPPDGVSLWGKGCGRTVGQAALHLARCVVGGELRDEAVPVVVYGRAQDEPPVLRFRHLDGPPLFVVGIAPGPFPPAVRDGDLLYGPVRVIDGLRLPKPHTGFPCL